MGGAVDLSAANRAAMQKAWEEGRYFGPVVNVSEANPRGTGPDFAALGLPRQGRPGLGGVALHGRRTRAGAVRAEPVRAASAPTAAVTVNNTITVTGGTETLARQVADEIMRTVRAGTQLGTA